MAFPRLFSPLRLGRRQVRNRIVFGAHFTMYSEPASTYGEPGYFGERYGRYLAERARGGVGTIIAGQAMVHPTTAYQMANNAIAWDEAAVPHFRRLTGLVRPHGALTLLQLAHNGGVNQSTWSRLPVWAASDVANSLEVPQPVGPAEIAELVRGFARSAHHALAGGFDGVEIHAAHGYLLQEFLSPRSNRRSDEYGGDLAGRMRFPLEVLRAVRAAVGDDAIVGLRLVGDEESSDVGALGPTECAEIATHFARSGLVDFLNVSVGLSGIGMVRPMHAPHLCAVAAARNVKQALAAAGVAAEQVPVFAVQRILRPDEAEGVLAEGSADAVTLVRALIADPEWPEKARGGRAAEIRLCTGINQGCYGNLTQGLPVACVTNPIVGRESDLGGSSLRRAERRRRVVVVGAGPAGLEVAWVAAARGHEVIVLERAGQPGGKILLAAQLPGRTEIADLVHWRVGECARRGVELRCGVSADADGIVAMAPDAVVVATGGRATRRASAKVHPMPILGSDGAQVLDHETALTMALADRAAGRRPLGARVVLLDVIGHIEAIGLAEILADGGSEAILVTPMATPLLLDRETAAFALGSAARAGVSWRPNTALVRIAPGQVTLMDVFSRRPEIVDGVDCVVIRTHGVPADEIFHELQGRVAAVERIGDARAVRSADRAIFDGHVVGRSL